MKRVGFCEMPRKKRPKNSLLPRILILAGLGLVAAVILMTKEIPKAATVPAELPEKQLAQALAEGKPTLAFYHSNNCKSCLEMVDIVNQVFPAFRSSVELVDINVYDPQNAQLLNLAGIRYIPTLIFYDSTGRSQTSVGVMEASGLREMLQSLSEGR
jgi:thiol-disulfide isomerase/thioredoxin